MSRDIREKDKKRITFCGAFAALACGSKSLKSKHKELIGSKVRVNLSASEIRSLAEGIIAESEKVHDVLASVPLDKVRYEDIKILAELETQHFPIVQSCVFPQLVSDSDDVHEASSEAQRRMELHFASCRKREDVYRVVKALAVSGEWMNDEAKCYVEFLVREFERNGLNLSSAEREEVQRLQADINGLSMKYAENLTDDCTSLLFTEKELDGLPAEFLQILERASGGKIKVPLRSSYVSQLLQHCRVGATRRKVALTFGQRCKEVNLPLLENLVTLREKLARLLGYDNYGEYAVSCRMIKKSLKVLFFVEDLSASLSAVSAKELAILKNLKKQEEGDGAYEPQDLLYYKKRFGEEKCNIDFEALKEYFPLNIVLQGIFNIFRDLLGLRFKEVMDAEVWHKDVRVFSVFHWKSGELIGYVYLDLYSRKGKSGQTCVVPLQNGSLPCNGARQVPIVLLISEFSKHDGKCPILLQFSEVLNLFHQFGHVAHRFCYHSSIALLSGLCADPDFVEIPGLMFENLCYESTVLKRISGHYQDTRRPITDDVCMSLTRWRHSFSALKLTQAADFCHIDHAIHRMGCLELLQSLQYLERKAMFELFVLDGRSSTICLPPSAIDNGGTCYSRLWSKVFAADLYASFRNKVLAPGGANHSLECLSHSIGNELPVQAFVDTIASSHDE